MPERYGTIKWFENLFNMSDDDPWGHDWRGIEHHRYDLVIKLIIEHILSKAKINNELKFLDIGCTTGNFTNRLHELNRNVIGIDISQMAIKRAKIKFGYIDFRVDSLPNSGFQNNTFDLITCLEVLYYMDKNTQKRFLCEVDNLLKKDGRALVTSVIGQKPYFESNGLINLLSEHFEIKAVEYYGSKVYSSIEAILFTKYQQISRIQRLLTSNCQDLKEEIEKFKKKIIIKKMIYFIVKFKLLIFITYTLLKILKNNIKIILGLKFPAKAFHFISKKMSFEPTHTLVLVSIREE